MPEIFYIFLFGHLLGDFYFQTKTMAERKQAKIRAVNIHALIYWLTVSAVSVPLLFLNIAAAMAASAGLGIAHYCVDLIKYIIKHLLKKSKEDSFSIFIIDQMLHIAVILVVSYVLLGFIPKDGLTALFQSIHNISYSATVRLLVVLALMGRPANIIFKMLLKAGKAEDRLVDAAEGIKNAGAIIGTLERVVVSVMFFLGEYASVAIVLTAKSIARYSKLKTDPKFTEYYLIGTLSSITYAMLVSILFFQSA